jgi:rhodanese-related sulfurtransferase
MLKYATPEGNKKIKILKDEAKKLLNNNKAVIVNIKEDKINHEKVLNISPEELEKKLHILPKDKIIIVSCNTHNRSPFAALFLRENGFDAKYLVDGTNSLKEIL